MRAAVAVLAALAIALSGAPGAFGQPVQEYELKAAFLFNFALLTEWPRGLPVAPDATFGMCVIGRNPFGNNLAKLQGKQIHGRRIALREVTSPATARDCHVLFIASSEAMPVNEIVESLGESNVLTVAESGDDRATAAAITLLTQDQRVAFAVNLRAARRAQLHISPRLLRLAVQVVDG